MIIFFGNLVIFLKVGNGRPKLVRDLSSYIKFFRRRLMSEYGLVVFQNTILKIYQTKRSLDFFFGIFDQSLGQKQKMETFTSLPTRYLLNILPNDSVLDG